MSTETVPEEVRKSLVAKAAVEALETAQVGLCILRRCDAGGSAHGTTTISLVDGSRVRISVEVGELSSEEDDDD